jgi:Fe2+ transport system protein B
VTFTERTVRVLGEVVEIVDLPGTYNLAGTNPAEWEVFNYLASHSVDAIINVIDASHLSQGLELTLELLDLQRPLVVLRKESGTKAMAATAAMTVVIATLAALLARILGMVFLS